METLVLLLSLSLLHHSRLIDFVCFVAPPSSDYTHYILRQQHPSNNGTIWIRQRSRQWPCHHDEGEKAKDLSQKGGEYYSFAASADRQ